jgi:DDE superfamily endonuclease
MDAVVFFGYGLERAGHSWNKTSLEGATKLDFHRFRSFYGIGPKACKNVFEEIKEKRLVKNPKIDHFLVALSWMKQYPTESNHAGHWRLTENTSRNICWKYAEAFQELKEHKIKWTCHDPDNLPDEVFIASVDGVHCMISEIRSNPDKKWFSHKHKTAGVVYELAIAVFNGSLIWINGPFPAGQSDLAVFRKPGGLKSKIPDGKRVIADQGYKAENILSTRNPMDTPEVKELKRRAKARHEVFNGLLKNFQILSTRFRTTHGGEQERLDRHKRVFEGCCVLVMYEIEDDHPLFKV